MTNPIGHHLVVTPDFIPASECKKWLIARRRMGVRRITFVTPETLHRIQGMVFTSVEIVEENLTPEQREQIMTRIRP